MTSDIPTANIIVPICTRVPPACIKVVPISRAPPTSLPILPKKPLPIFLPRPKTSLRALTAIFKLLAAGFASYLFQGIRVTLITSDIIVASIIVPISTRAPPACKTVVTRSISFPPAALILVFVPPFVLLRPKTSFNAPTATPILAAEFLPSNFSQFFNP